MNAASPETIITEANGTNGAIASRDGDWPALPFHDNLGDHPMYQEFLDALKASREADIAEANRLADLEQGT